jgi:hypothetical protein
MSYVKNEIEWNIAYQEAGFFEKIGLLCQSREGLMVEQIEEYILNTKDQAVCFLEYPKDTYHPCVEELHLLGSKDTLHRVEGFVVHQETVSIR